MAQLKPEECSDEEKEIIDELELKPIQKDSDGFYEGRNLLKEFISIQSAKSNLSEHSLKSFIRFLILKGVVK